MGAEAVRRDLIAAACGVRTARDAAAAAARAAPGLGLGRTPRKSDGSCLDEDAALFEKVLETREESVGDGEAGVDLPGEGDGRGGGEGLGAGGGALMRARVLGVMLGLCAGSSESESDEEWRRSRSSTARR